MINHKFLVDYTQTLYRIDDMSFAERGIILFQEAMDKYPEYVPPDFSWVYEMKEDTLGEEALVRIAVKNPNYIGLKLPNSGILWATVLVDALVHVVAYFH